MWEASTQLQTTLATQKLLKYNQLAKTETSQCRKACRLVLGSFSQLHAEVNIILCYCSFQT